MNTMPFHLPRRVPTRWGLVLLVAIVALTIVGTLQFSAHGASSQYYVATNGSDQNDGRSLAQPFRTIQKCANVVAAGESCLVRGGTYREAVTIAHSGTATAPIVFQPYQGEQVTVSGAEVVQNWSQTKNSIYTATVPAQMKEIPGQFSYQVFVDGQMINEARWPNTSFDLVHPTEALSGKGTTLTTVCDPALASFVPGYWTGAHLHISAGLGWWEQTSVVTGSGSGSSCPAGSGYITFKRLYNYDQFFATVPNDRYYLFGKQEALDSAGEWYYDQQTSKLSIWTPQSDSPAQHTIEFKQRLTAFDLGNTSYVQVKGMHLFAATLQTGAQSNHELIDGLDARYISHFTQFDEIQGQVAGQSTTGIMLHGTHNILQNSSIAYSAGSGVLITGSNNTVTNNLIRDVNYEGTNNGGITIPWAREDVPQGPNIVISHNTIHETGGAGIDHQLMGSTIEYNDIYHFATIVNDVGGGIHTGGLHKGDPNTLRTVIAYNWVHDDQENVKLANLIGAATGLGIYFDVAASPYTIHHNVVWNMSGADLVLNGNIDDNEAHNQSFNNLVYNNTFASKSSSIGGFDGHFDGSRIVNNIFRSSVNASYPGAYVAHNLEQAKDPLFANAQAYNYQLQANSPARGVGEAIPGITSDSTPDLGAYAYGAPAWKAGCNLSASSTPPATFDPKAHYVLINQKSGQVLDIAWGSTAAGAAAMAWPNNGGANQHWSIVSIGQDAYQLVNQKSGKVLDVSGASKANAAAVIQWPNNGGANQHWRIVPVGGGYYQLISQNSGQVLDLRGGSTTSGTRAIQWPDNGQANQHWRIVQV